MRKFIIDQPKEKIKDGYYIEIKFMHGDADGTTYETIGPFFSADSNVYANEFLDFLDYILEGYDCKKRRCSKNYVWPDKYKKYLDYSEENEIFFTMAHRWPSDRTCDYQICASLERYRVYYISNGVEYSVKIVKG